MPLAWTLLDEPNLASAEGSQSEITASTAVSWYEESRWGHRQMRSPEMRTLRTNLVMPTGLQGVCPWSEP